MASSIFQLLRILPMTTGGTFIEWKLHPAFVIPTPITFTCQYSHSGSIGTDGWVDLPNVLVGDARTVTYSNVDRTQRVFSLADRIFYRIKMVASDGQVFRSAPQSPYYDLPKVQRLQVKYIFRDQFLRMKMGAGTCGFLFKRKYWGTRCTNPNCMDRDTHEIRGRRCTVCLGTGWVGGYTSAIPYWVEFSDNAPEKISTVSPGQGFLRVVKVRAIMCPELQTADIFLDPATDARWWVDSVEVTAQVRNYPLLADVVMKQVEPSSAVSLLDANHAG